MLQIWLIDMCAHKARWYMYSVPLVLPMLPGLCSPTKCNRQRHPSRVVDLPERKRVELFLHAVRIFCMLDQLSLLVFNIALTRLSLFDLLIDLFKQLLHGIKSADLARYHDEVILQKNFKIDTERCGRLKIGDGGDGEVSALF